MKILLWKIKRFFLGILSDLKYGLKCFRSIKSGFVELQQQFNDNEGFVTWESVDGEYPYYVCAVFNDRRHIPLPILLRWEDKNNEKNSLSGGFIQQLFIFFAGVKFPVSLSHAVRACEEYSIMYDHECRSLNSQEIDEVDTSAGDDELAPQILPDVKKEGETTLAEKEYTVCGRKMVVKALFEHDCNKCKFLGSFLWKEEDLWCDLYYHGDGGFSAPGGDQVFIARFGEDGEYASSSIPSSPYLIEAMKRAVLSGLITDFDLQITGMREEEREQIEKKLDMWI